MGYPIYVLVWTKNPEDGKYYYSEVYSGRSWFKALLAMYKAKQNNYGCIKLEWRP